MDEQEEEDAEKRTYSQNPVRSIDLYIIDEFTTSTKASRKNIRSPSFDIDKDEQDIRDIATWWHNPRHITMARRYIWKARIERRPHSSFIYIYTCVNKSQSAIRARKVKRGVRFGGFSNTEHRIREYQLAPSP